MYDYTKDLKEREERDAGLINLITNYAIENQMTAEAVDKCVEKVKEVFYSFGLIRRS